MGRAFFLIAYGMAWGYVIHAKEIDKKLVAIARDLWEEGVRTRVAVEMNEYDRQMAYRASLDIMPDTNISPHPEGAKIVAAG